ncbi:deoxyribodipyrimidine photo-lyase [Pelagicoccus sp. SDUM812005]|uniref:cryptochrome/photolyase family protein n=1 Tax=Pelagicoccus sp. SDUM812005 TaxID=3041257 RepID=UPI00280E2CA4|nr:deoxyribodipyrimidine photo-lyase [Pelagicoccus sp. SDUM812005]MDQ8179835.1 deoxyribodipyrimidine photo-lyase [Pelagicoccus sp. SDUM812005]
MSEHPPVILWFRRDLRLADNPALQQACEGGQAVLPVFVLDEEGEGDWPEGAASKWWLHHSLSALDKDLRELGSRLLLLKGAADEALAKLCGETGASGVFWNRRYEPSIVARDTALKKRLAEQGVQVRSFNGSLLQSPLSVTNKSGTPFKVFTPFWKHIQNLGTREPLGKPQALAAPASWPKGEALESFGLLPQLDWADAFGEEWTPGERGGQVALAVFRERYVGKYSQQRDTPAVRGVSRLSPHLHFGELSPNQGWYAMDRQEHEPYLRQIAWREFAHHLLFHFTDTPAKPLRPEFEAFPWKPDSRLLEAWQKGQTGYPIVDAGMRELWKTGWMHNRVRMIASSFLVKHLLQPWQAGAQWFWDTLVDADLANNTMGWQWVAGCGADAAPYFRIFNPITQGERFDGGGDYTRKWVPEIAGLPDKYLFKPWEAPANVLEKAGIDLGNTYPKPIVDHPRARQAALDAYAAMKA